MLKIFKKVLIITFCDQINLRPIYKTKSMHDFGPTEAGGYVNKTQGFIGMMTMYSAIITNRFLENNQLTNKLPRVCRRA